MSEWLTIDCERALYVDQGRTTVLCDRLPSPVTLVIKLSPPCDSGSRSESRDNLLARGEARVARWPKAIRPSLPAHGVREMSDSQRARELLAQAFEASGHDRNAADVRRGFKPGHCTPLWMDEALSAIDQAIADERAAIVKWLRTEMPYLDHPLEYADAIESGEHSK